MMAGFREDLTREDLERTGKWSVLRSEEILIRRTPEGYELDGDHWPSMVLVVEELFDLVEPALCSAGDGMMRLTVTNGDALYGRKSDGPWEGTGLYELIRGVVDGPR